MNIDINKIKEIYGIETLNLIKDNIKDVIKNINYLEQLGFTDTIDIFERYTLIFIEDVTYFKQKIDKLISELGDNYVDLIENDLSILDKLY